MRDEKGNRMNKLYRRAAQNFPWSKQRKQVNMIGTDTCTIFANQAEDVARIYVY
jgi:hypothetical protein